MLILLPPHGCLHNYNGTVLQHAPPPSTKQLLISKIPLTKMQEALLKSKHSLVILLIQKKTVVNNTKEIESLEERVNLLHPECGSQEWTRVGYLDMSDASQSCPDALRLYSVSGVRACGRRVSSVASCDSITFTTNNTYTEVCGRVIGYQYASPDAFKPRINTHWHRQCLR